MKLKKATPKTTQRPAIWWSAFLRRVTRSTDGQSYVQAFSQHAQLKPAVYDMGGKEVVL